MNSKLPTEHSIDELLRSLDSEDVPEVNETNKYEDNVLRFISIYNLTPGTNVVKTRLLYHLYKETVEHPLTLRQFSDKLIQYLPYGTGCFKLSVEAMELGEKLYRLVKERHKYKTKSKHYKAHYELFLAENNIKPGRFYVESFVLYYLYDYWRFNTKKKTLMVHQEFCEFSKVYLPTRKLSVKTLQWYGIDREPIKDILTDEKLQEIRNWHEKGNKQKIKRNVSRTKSKSKS